MTPEERKEYAVKYAHKRRVVIAAYRFFKSGLEYIAIGPRHGDPTMRLHMDLICNVLGEKPAHKDVDQGFIDQWGNFMDREEALVIAKKQNQILEKQGYDKELFSEDLY